VESLERLRVLLLQSTYLGYTPSMAFALFIATRAQVASLVSIRATKNRLGVALESQLIARVYTSAGERTVFVREWNESGDVRLLLDVARKGESS